MTTTHEKRQKYFVAEYIKRLLASDRFFYAIFICFIIQALWLALTARYPMAFDENFHFGLIQLHASQWLPFFTHQPTGANAYGAVTRDPSYLYHFLMSYPYRLIKIFTRDTTIQIISLRILNIAIFAYGFLLTRKLLLRLGSSRPLAHLSLFLFSFMPIVPFLAAQINYDNLLLPITAGTFLIVCGWVDELHAQKLSFARTAILISLLLLGCLVKYAFLPVLAATLGFMVWKLWRHRRYWTIICASLTRSIRHTRKIQVGILSGLTLISCGLFSQQYVVNLIKYHNPIPDCAKVLTVKECAQYGPWIRNFTYAQQLPASFKPDLPDYIWQWFYGMWQRSFFAISDTYVTMPPLPLIGGAAIVLAVLGGIFFLRYSKRILVGNVYRQYGLVTIVVYMLCLFIYTYKSYVYTGIPVAINGRYLVPFLPVVFLFIGLAFGYAFKKYQNIKTAAIMLTMLCFLQGGGALTFIVQSDETWNWPSGSVVHANNTARKVLHPLIPGSRHE